MVQWRGGVNTPTACDNATAKSDYSDRFRSQMSLYLNYLKDKALV